MFAHLAVLFISSSDPSIIHYYSCGSKSVILWESYRKKGAREDFWYVSSSGKMLELVSCCTGAEGALVELPGVGKKLGGTNFCASPIKMGAPAGIYRSAQANRCGQMTGCVCPSVIACGPAC